MARTLEDRTVLVIGAGSLGGPAALVLAGAGVGRLVLVDDALTNSADLSAQPALAEVDLGRPRAAALAAQLTRRFPAVVAEPVEAHFGGASAARLVAAADVVVDASSEPAVAFAANDAAVAAGKPFVHGGVLQLSAQVLSVLPGETGCLRCLFERPPAPEDLPAGLAAGLLGPLAGLAGALMGHEALHLLQGRPAAYAGRLLAYGARAGQGRLVPVRRRAGCEACGGAPAKEEASP